MARTDGYRDNDVPASQISADFAVMSAAMSIDVEDWFHSENVKKVCPRASWDLHQLRVEHNTMRMLEILSDQGARATFFVLGWVAQRCPQLVRAISDAGHEVASHGHGHDLVYAIGPDAFRADVARSKAMIEDLTGAQVRGYRAPCFSITDWAIPILQDAGYSYDSSVVPAVAHDRYGRLDGVDRGTPISELRDGFHEVSVSCLPLGKRGIPWGGGGYFRLIPYPLWRVGVRAIQRAGVPYVFYIHPWEIDPGQPLPGGVTRINRFRQCVNLSRCEARFAAISGDFNWTTVGGLLDQWLSVQTSSDSTKTSATTTDSKVEALIVDQSPKRRVYS
jgi:polysaccharide deacetylase family protein (PEP-CTERM system associated)